MTVALITGGSSGIGLATVRRLAEGGDQVFYASRKPAAVPLAGDVTHVPLDLADPRGCEAAVQSVLDEAGRLDVLVNNAGTAVLAPLEEGGDTEAHQTFEVNVFGPMRLIRAALPVMRAQGGGRIINVTSVNDIAPAPFGGWYSASKAALASLSMVLGAELHGSGIFVTVVAPGLFVTGMSEQLPFARVAGDSRYAAAFEKLRAESAMELATAGDPDEVARAIAECIGAEQPPARIVVGADGLAMDETFRKASAEDLATMLREYVASLTRPSTPLRARRRHAKLGRMRRGPMAVMIAAAIALTAAGCTESDGTTAATPAVTPACASPDYCPPASWDTAKASTPLAQIAAFSEPLNVVISARSTVSLGAIQQAMGKWDTVSTATTVTLSGIHLKCISSEQADVTGAGYVPQHVAWRLGGCVQGNALSLTGDEDHARIWNQPFKGSKDGAWFIAVSYETLCLDRNGTLTPASTTADDETYAAVHPSDAYHCVDGGPGSIHSRHPDGYEDGAATFVAAIASAAKAKGWHYSQRTVTVTGSADAGEGGVPFNGDVYVLTVTA